MSLIDDDLKHIWHPLTQYKNPGKRLAIKNAKNDLLFDEEGSSYIDGIASWYTCMYGHCNPLITEKVKSQLDQLDQIVFTGFTHKPAVELSKRLIKILPPGQSKLFFSDNGSTSVEIAIKMALQYYQNKGEPKTKILAFENGFHGDTFGAMAASDESIYNAPFVNWLIDVERIPVPNENNLRKVLNQLESYLQSNEFAGFVYEPLVQGAAGMLMHEPEHLNAVLKLCKAHKVLCIADEVMTGLGKTGKHFASDWVDTKPDLICLSKALTAGISPMAITSCSQEIYKGFLFEEKVKGFFHAHTYSGNPVGCSAALAGLDLLESNAIQRQIAFIHSSHLGFKKRIQKHPKVKEARVKGVIFALTLNAQDSVYGELRDKLFNYYSEEGVYLRPLGPHIYILAPYTIEQMNLEKIYRVIEQSLELV